MFCRSLPAHWFGFTKPLNKGLTSSEQAKALLPSVCCSFQLVRAGLSCPLRFGEAKCVQSSQTRASCQSLSHWFGNPFGFGCTYKISFVNFIKCWLNKFPSEIYNLIKFTKEILYQPPKVSLRSKERTNALDWRSQARTCFSSRRAVAKQPL